MKSRGRAFGDRVYLALALLVLALLSSVVLSHIVYADEEGAKEKEKKEEKKLAKAASSLAFYLGIVLNLLFVFYKWLYPLIVKMGVKPVLSMRQALLGHSLSNALLGLLALYHAAYFRDKAGPVEYAAAALIILILSTGTAILVIRRGKARRLAIALHLQRLLSIALLISITLHVALVGGD